MNAAVKGLAAAAGIALLFALWWLTRVEESVEQWGVVNGPATGAIVRHDVRSPVESLAPTAQPASSAGALRAESPAVGAGGGPTPSGATGSAEARSEDPPGRTHVNGVAQDDHGVALAGHTVEVRDRGEVEGRFVTGEDGRFHIGGLLPGEKVLRLLGPGAGDALEGCIGKDACSTALAPIERSMNVTLPGEGLEHVTIVVRGHNDRLFAFRVVDDLDRPLAHCSFTLEGLGADVVARSDESGMICKHVAVTEDLALRLSFLESFDESETPTYLPLEFRLTPTTKPDLGSLVMARMAVLALNLTDRASGKGVYEASVQMQCTGAGLPPTDVLGTLQSDGSYLLRTRRSNGEYVIDVSAPGYRPARQVGVLIASDGPVPLELILERNR